MTDRIKIGKISAASGLKGEVKLFHDSGESERLAGIRELFLSVKKRAPDSGSTEQVRYGIRKLRFQGKIPILTLQGVTTRSEAEALIGAEVCVDKESLVPLDEDSYYVSDLIGATVTDTKQGALGDVVGILDNPAHDILRIKPDNGSEILLPFIEAFVSDVDMKKGSITVTAPNGLLDVNRPKQQEEQEGEA